MRSAGCSGVGGADELLRVGHIEPMFHVYLELTREADSATLE